MRSRIPHRRPVLALLAVPAVMAGALSGCQGGTPAAKTPAVDWSTVCHGRGGADIRQLLSGGAGATVRTHWKARTGEHDLFIDQLCQVRTSGGAVNVLVTSQPGTTAPHLLENPPAAPATPAPEPFTVGEGGRLWPAHADGVLTCHQGDGTAVPVVVDIGLTGSAARNPRRGPLLEHLTRAWVASVATGSSCRKPA